MEKASLASLMSVDARDLFSAFPGPAGLYCVCVGLWECALKPVNDAGYGFVSHC